MAIQRTSRRFKDISLSFSPHPVTRDLPVLLNERAIVRSVRNLVETIPTERFFDSDLGTDVRASLFENFNATTVTIIEDQVRSTIRRYEPRVDDIGVEVDGLPDRNALDIKVIFTIKGLDIPRQEFNFILESTR
jgi:phage baseplate assembly protein W|tara:strand:- start:177 stop:578 length:402 start_codon:yes stop_codon:yes gene_type:complete